jgi:hypothetical protein
MIPTIFIYTEFKTKNRFNVPTALFPKKINSEIVSNPFFYRKAGIVVQHR